MKNSNSFNNVYFGNAVIEQKIYRVGVYALTADDRRNSGWAGYRGRCADAPQGKLDGYTL